ncbi:MAG: multifunctional 2-oxoglutarate metabolism enzyme, partial [Frankiaceae bacterium]|nr:multifunctional 2-oxoglutarate metabolism enzyme [Frankiaceae bacterium]
MTAPSDPGTTDQFAGFGPNEWLVYEMYQQWLKDPDSVDKAWWDFFADYKPDAPASANGATPAEPTPAEPVRSEPKAVDPEPAPAVSAKPAAVAAPPAATQPAAPAAEGASTKPLKGAAARVVTNMEASLTVPTATSVR